MERRQLLSTYVVTDTTDTASFNSLRWAVLQVNSDSTADTIQFNIPASGVQTIQLSLAAAVDRPFRLDRRHDRAGLPTDAVDRRRWIEGGSNADGLVLSAGRIRFKDWRLVGFSGSAIALNSLGGNVVQGNFLGVNASGTVADPDGEGISIVASANTIGGGSTASGNVISGNSGNGIQIETGSGGASNNLIEGNLIGTTANGLGGLGSAERSSDRRHVRQPDRCGRERLRQYHLRNVVAIQLTGAARNVMRTTRSELPPMASPPGNGGDGILLDNAPGTEIGGTDQNQANVIGCNQGNGINIKGGPGVLVSGNFIGTTSPVLMSWATSRTA